MPSPQHGFSVRNGDNTPQGAFAKTGKFGRMFPELPAFTPPIDSLVVLGNAMIDDRTDPSEPLRDHPDGDNRNVPAGFTYLGQFVDHDLTFDPTSLKEKQVDPQAVVNFRTPALDLDSVYGSGPDDQPYLFQLKDKEKFLIGKNEESSDANGVIVVKGDHDLPRAPSTVALLGDPRNDENLLVAQTHLAILKFHNKIVDGLRDGSIPRKAEISKTVFEEARQLVVWHYQWIVVFDFLDRILDSNQVNKVLSEGRKFYKFNTFPFIPVEFSVAAYRLGHSMIRSSYDYNRVFTFKDIAPDSFTPATLGLLFNFTGKSRRMPPDGPGLEALLPTNWIIDWRRFFEIDPAVPVNHSRKLDPFLVNPLKDIPNIPDVPNMQKPTSLAVRNLLRGRSMGLPSGQSVARFMKLKPLSSSEIASGSDGAVAKQFCFDKETPLWYYILKEAHVQQKGLRLGEVGSRIVAEVFLGLLEGDSDSFFVRNRNWKPTLPAKVPGTFTFADLICFTKDISPIDGLEAPVPPPAG
ncbi:peroxidase [Phormidium sp. FACHB-592]|uniref:Heme peroxidase family protein n=1 Tax=Stenomitos frigidus AS-A4 TaxID=2933935 RepID=A0ABV0KRL9_9CYAN|nr:heme peroxidase family protein [Phormidium sp. FACHB-592]MBD2075541.1 peroxidase [Phormidium sp. FACHB-592]